MSLLTLRVRGRTNPNSLCTDHARRFGSFKTGNKELEKIRVLGQRIISALFWGALLTFGTMAKGRSQKKGKENLLTRLSAYSFWVLDSGFWIPPFILPRAWLSSL
jgi:hypothetical protein